MTEFNHLSSPNTQSRRIHSSSCFTTPISGSSSPSRNITTIDVYDLAAEIGKDFEYLADKYGRNSIDGIMPKVISALETLELLAKKNSEETDEITELKNSVDILENEKKIRIKERTTLEIELEQSEDHYRKEIDELKEIVKLLQQENKQRKKEFNENCDSEVFNNDLPRESDLEQIMILREEVSSQQKKMTQFRHDNDKLSDENVNLQNCVEKLIRQNQELVRKNESLGSQARVLIQEKNDLNRTNHKIEIKIIELSKRLSEKNRICQDLESLKRNDSKKGDNSDEDAPKFTLRELKEVLQEKNILKARVMELDEYMEDILKKLRAYEEKERLDRANNPSE
uniref:RH1 domain-containing protein n=1 Tax=Rhabditophanes sp. KR3021 TaxID=114890 RepID=A0AC35U371_9BILA